MLRKDRSEVAGKRHVVAYEDPYPNHEAEAHGFVVRVTKPERETKAVAHGFEVKNAKEFHAVGTDGVFVLHDIDVAERKGFEQGIDERDVRYRFVGVGRFRWKNRNELVASE